MNNDEIIFTIEDIAPTTGAMLEDVLNDKPLGVAFAIDPGETDTNYWSDPYFKFYPDSFNRDKANIVYRVYFQRAAWVVHRDKTGKQTPSTMNNSIRSLLMSSLLEPRLPSEKQLKKKHKDINNPDLISTYTALCVEFNRIAVAMGKTNAVFLTGNIMPNYFEIEFEAHS